MDLEGLNNFDIKAGALLRQLTRLTEKKDIIGDIKYSHCIPYVIFISPADNGKGGHWFYIGKKYEDDHFSGINDNLNTVYDFRCLNKHFKEDSFLRKKLDDVAAGNLPYTIMCNHDEYITHEEANIIINNARDFYKTNFPEYREIIYNDDLIFDERNAKIRGKK